MYNNRNAILQCVYIEPPYGAPEKRRLSRFVRGSSLSSLAATIISGTHTAGGNNKRRARVSSSTTEEKTSGARDACLGLIIPYASDKTTHSRRLSSISSILHNYRRSPRRRRLPRISIRLFGTIIIYSIPYIDGRFSLPVRHRYTSNFICIRVLFLCILKRQTRETARVRFICVALACPRSKRRHGIRAIHI